MNELIKRAIEYLRENYNIAVADILKDVASELTDVNEAFELGLALGDMRYHEQETSCTGFTEKEIEEIIDYVNENIQQARY